MTTKQCAICKAELDVSNFGKRGKYYTAYCYTCTREYRNKRNKRNVKAVSKKQRKWIKENPEKYRAHIAVFGALRSGKLVRQPCEVCGNPKVETHHDDYTKPLEVRWLCRTHHLALHNARRSRSRPIR
jgi:uncharacterized Zn finger protein (UPF0148 family)